MLYLASARISTVYQLIKTNKQTNKKHAPLSLNCSRLNTRDPSELVPTLRAENKKQQQNMCVAKNPQNRKQKQQQNTCVAKNPQNRKQKQQQNICMAKNYQSRKQKQQ